MLIYAFAAGNVSIAALFLAGFVPGLLLGFGMMGVTAILARSRGHPIHRQSYTIRETIRIVGRFMIAAILPVIMVAGIVGGVASPTEAGAIAILYALFIGFFVTRELTAAALYSAMRRTVIVTSVVMIIVAFGNVSTWWLTIEGMPRAISESLQAFTSSPVVFLALMLVFYLVIGLFIEQAAAMVMLVPIFAPLAVSYGIEPVHFGLFTCLTLALGLVTPPVGLCLFVASGIASVPVQRVFRAVLPYIAAMQAVVLLVTFMPAVYLWLPAAFGY